MVTVVVAEDSLLEDFVHLWRELDKNVVPDALCDWT